MSEPKEEETPLEKAERIAKEKQDKFEEDFDRVDRLGEDEPEDGKVERHEEEE